MMALDDVTILDLSHALAGPYASTLLADFGARVIKIEPPGSGDIARHWGPPRYGDDSVYFVTVHRNKLSVEIDLKHAEGRRLFLDLVEKADVVLENFRVGVVEKLGIDYPRVSARNPRIVYCSISGYGQDGPYRERAAMDTIVQAESGIMSFTGEEGHRPVRNGISIADLTAGINAAIGILMALHARQRSGEGQLIDVSMLEGQLGLLDHVLGNYFATGIPWKPMGSSSMNIVPYQMFATRSRDIAIGVGSDGLWRAFCPALGIAELTDDPRYATNRARVQNRAALCARLQEVFLTRSYEEWEPILLAAGIPVGAVNDMASVARHPQVAARGVLVDLDHPVAGKVKVVAPFFRMSGTPGTARTAAPLLGEHTEQVLREQLGLSASDVERLRRAGASGHGRAAKAAPGTSAPADGSPSTLRS